MVGIRTPLNWLHYLICLLGVAPVYTALALPAQIVFPAALCGGILADRRDRPPLPDRVATFVSILFFAYYARQVNLSNLVGPTVNILALLIAVRLLSVKNGRHLLQNYALALFSLAASALLRLEASFVVYLILIVFAIAVSLVLLTYLEADENIRLDGATLRKIITVSLLMPGVALVLMVFFFAILPRTEHPLWNFLNPNDVTKVGFSEEVRPGTVSQMAEGGETVFRAEMKDVAPEDLYWRGIVLSHIDGSNWRRRDDTDGAPPAVIGGSEIRTVIYPEPTRRRYLFALDQPGEVSGVRAQRDSEGTLTLRRVPLKRFRYEVVSYRGAQLEETGPTERWLQLPQEISPRVLALSERLRERGATIEERFDALVEHFRDQQFQYSQRDLPRGNDPIAEFLFERKAGYCEFFASSFALLARLLDIPARLVGGYHGGSYNELGDYYLVSENQAHVWVEVLLDGRWQRFDPSTLATNPPNRGGTLGDWRFDWQGLTDAVDYYWQRAVIVYDFERQLQLLFSAGRNLREIRPTLRKPEPGTVALLLGGLLLGGTILYRLTRRARRDPLLHAYLQRVARRYPTAPRPPECGLEELADSVDDPLCRRFAAIYGGALYRDRELTRAERQELKEIVLQLKERNERSGGKLATTSRKEDGAIEIGVPLIVVAILGGIALFRFRDTLPTAVVVIVALAICCVAGCGALLGGKGGFQHHAADLRDKTADRSNDSEADKDC